MSTIGIAESDIETFERDGVVCLRGAFDAEWMARIERGIESELATPGPRFLDQQDAGQPGRFVTAYCTSQHIPEFQSFALESPAGGIVASLLRSRSAGFLMDVLWIKEPGTEKRTAWHQDQPYFCIDGRQFCSIWLPVDPVDEETSLRFIRGSHRWGRWFKPQLSRHGQRLYEEGTDGSPYEAIPDFDAELDQHEVLSWAFEPGDCLVFHGLTVHGAPGNAATERRRRVISTVWFGDDATYGIRPSPPRPNFEGHGLAPGAPMDSPYFPRVWPRAEGAAAEAGATRFAADTALRISI
jgi:ectoine hydroxylase-related dioxygenase (phytanoyl-CoA dioxygenase family)